MNICNLCLVPPQQGAALTHQHIGAYKDDWLVVSSTTKRQIEKVKKEIAKIFKQNGLPALPGKIPDRCNSN